MLNVQEKKRDYNKDANLASAVRRFFPKIQAVRLRLLKRKVYPNESFLIDIFSCPKASRENRITIHYQLRIDTVLAMILPQSNNFSKTTQPKPEIFQ